MISVCIATYNGEPYIRQQLESILCQLGPYDEVVVSDDGSTDATLSIIRSIDDSRIRIFEHAVPPRKASFLLDRPTHNFENALGHIRGDIIFLSDQDDVWMPQKVEVMCRALDHADLAIHDCVVMNDTLDRTIEPSYFRYIRIHTGLWRNIIRCTYLGCCMAMRRNVVEAALPFPKTGVGHDLWIGIVAAKQFRTTLVREPLLQYRRHKHSHTTSGTPSRHSILFKISYRISMLKYVFRLYFWP